jgi:hypothetical protein
MVRGRVAEGRAVFGIEFTSENSFGVFLLLKVLMNLSDLGEISGIFREP